MVVTYANYLASKGHDVTIMANKIDTVFQVRAKIQIISLIKNKLSTVLKAFTLNSDADVIIADIIAMIFLLSLRQHDKVLYFAQDYDVSYYKNPFLRFLTRTFYRISCRLFAIPTIAVSHDLGYQLTRDFGAKVSVVPNGVDTKIFYPERTEEYLSAKGKSRVVLILARSDYRKGYDIALDSLNRMSHEIIKREVQVWSVGEIIPSTLPIRQFGLVSADDLRRILSCSDVLLYPSRHEGLPLFVLEAMACGCPVVTTKAVGFVSHGINALQAPIEDEETMARLVIEVLHNSDLRESLIKAGHTTAEQMSLTDSMAAFENHILHLFPAKNVPAGIN